MNNPKSRNPPEPAVVPAPPWARPARKPPRTQLTREGIVAAALRLVDRQGLDALSMRRLADELGTGAASLYWHVQNREELLNLMIDAVVGEIRLPKQNPARWQQQLKELGREMRRALGSHRDIARATMGRIPFGPNVLRVSEWTLGLLRRAELPDRVTALVMDLFALYVGAFAMEESSGVPVSPAEDAAGPAQVVEMYRAYFHSLPPEQFPNTTALADLLVEGDVDDRFEFGMDVLISGLATQSASARGAGSATRRHSPR